MLASRDGLCSMAWVRSLSW